MFLRKPENYFVEVLNFYPETVDISCGYRKEDEEVKVDVPQNVYDALLNKMKKRNEDIFKKAIDATKGKLTKEQNARFHREIVKNIFIESIKSIEFLEPLKLKYLANDVSQWMSAFREIYNRTVNTYGCDKDDVKVPVISDGVLRMLQNRISIEYELLIRDIFGEADDFSIPQNIDLLTAFWEQLFDLHIEYASCFNNLKNNGTSYNKIKDEYYDIIKKFVIGSLEEAKAQEIQNPNIK